MSNFLINMRKNRNECLWMFGCLALCIWMLFGCFPLVNIEGDSSLYAAGCERMYQLGFSFPPDYIYQWNMQPLTAVVIVLLRYVLPLTCEQIYCLLTIFAAYGFLFVISKLIEKFTSVKWYKVVCFLFLLPEFYSIAFYPNTAIFAAVFGFLAFCLLVDKPLSIFGLLLLGIAPLFRVDILLVYPLIFFLLWQNRDFKSAFLYSALYAVVTVAILTIGCVLLKANPIETLIFSESVKGELTADINGLGSFLRIHVAYYTLLNILLTIIGFCTLLKTKEWKMLCGVLLPIVFTYVFYFPFRGFGPKHLLYILPCLGLCMIYSIHIIANWKKKHPILVNIILILLFLQYIIAISVVPSNKPWMGEKYASQHPYPTWSIYETNIRGNKLSIGLGAGQVIPTADEIMLVTGHIVAPWMWKNDKQRLYESREDVVDLLARFSSTDTIRFITTQSSDWQFSQLLHGKGYVMETNEFPLKTFKHEKLPYIETIWYNNLERTEQSFETAFNSIAHPAYIYYNWDWQQYYINEGLTSAKQIGNRLAIIE